MKQDIILIGGGGHCKACIDVIEQEGRFNILGVLDLPEQLGNDILNYKVIGSDDDIPWVAKKTKYFLITVGQIKSVEKRIALFQLVKDAGGELPVIISPTAYVAKTAAISEGTIVMHQSLVNANARIGANCIINTKALIEHDAVIGNHCHISTASVINGSVEVGEGSFIGSGAISVQGAKVKPGSFIRANSLFYGR
jgi:sugar O-acyltransferase (sialic acid O-acetyltransferase NeuD family)